MKKIFLSLMAALAMAFCFTACGDNEDSNEQTSATDSGKSLYDSYKNYSEIEGTTEADNIQKASAALALYSAYSDYSENKEDSEWVKEFATSAVYAIAEDKKEAAKTTLISKLSSEAGVTEGTIAGVATLVQDLGAIFGN